MKEAKTTKKLLEDTSTILDQVYLKVLGEEPPQRKEMIQNKGVKEHDRKKERNYSGG